MRCPHCCMLLLTCTLPSYEQYCRVRDVEGALLTLKFKECGGLCLARECLESHRVIGGKEWSPVVYQQIACVSHAVSLSSTQPLLL